MRNAYIWNSTWLDKNFLFLVLVSQGNWSLMLTVFSLIFYHRAVVFVCILKFKSFMCVMKVVGKLFGKSSVQIFKLYNFFFIMYTRCKITFILYVIANWRLNIFLYSRKWIIDLYLTVIIYVVWFHYIWFRFLLSVWQ